MIPVLTPAEMAEVDRTAPEPTHVLVHRAASAVARRAIEMMGGTYGRRVLVVAGPGNNGSDGRVASEILRRRGVRVHVVDATEPPERWPGRVNTYPPDLVIDAAFGTGFRGTYEFPFRDVAEVLAVDLSSGVSGLSGVASGRPATASATVTFAALKPGLLLGSGPQLSGVVTVADIGLDVSGARIHLVEDADLVTRVPRRTGHDHKWRHAVWLIAGSPGMSGAPRLASAAAFRTGAGYVRLSTPGDYDPATTTEVVHHRLDHDGWSDEVAEGARRFGAVAIGPGLGSSDSTRTQVRRLGAMSGFPLVVDGDALTLLGTDAPEILSQRSSPTVLTPHDGEFEALVGRPPGDDRIGDVRSLARGTGAHVLLKGPTTVVASPDGRVLMVSSGDSRLATAGTGDVLTGMISANLALGAEPLYAAGAAAQLHGLAASLGSPSGLVASDLVDLIPVAMDRTRARILASCQDMPT